VSTCAKQYEAGAFVFATDRENTLIEANRYRFV